MSTQEIARALIQRHGRTYAEEAGVRLKNTPASLYQLLVQSALLSPGIGPAGASIFCREVQDVWPDVAPYVDDQVAQGARVVGLPVSPDRLASCASKGRFVPLAAACVRAALSAEVAAEVSR